MADRVLNRAGTIYADLPGYTTPTVTVTDPKGTAVVTAASATTQGSSRWSYALTANQLTIAGLWTAVWTSGGNSKTQYFTVGYATAAGLTRWDLVLALASREHEVIEGSMSAYQPAAVVDTSLRGGAGSYLGRYVILHPDNGINLAGRFRRITAFNGSALTLASPFHADPAVDARYAIINADPLEVERALRRVFDDLSEASRIPMRVSGLTLAATNYTKRLEITLPAGLTRVDTIWVDNCASRNTVNGMELTQNSWEPVVGRKVRVTIDQQSLDVADTLVVRGTRQMRIPAFWDSEIDVESAPLVAGAAKELLAMRSGGPAVDVEEHLRRMLVAQQEFETSKRHSAGRPMPGSREVIP